VSRIFLSHSSTDNAEAVALGDWLADNGWKDEVFLDLDPQRGIAAGERWERKLHEAANRCEAVLFLVSKAWLSSVWCRQELNLAHSLNKRLFGVLIEDLPLAALPEDLGGTWQIVRLATGRDHVVLRAVLPITHEEAHVHFSAEGLARLKHGLVEAGLDPKYFAWPPQNDESRPPYRGLRPLEAEDAGIFFGRDAPIVEALDWLRGLRASAPPRLLIILGASGAGKSSFLRAGLFPRLARDDRNFLPLPVIRPERAAVSGERGLLSALEASFAAARIPITRAELRAIVQAGAAKLKPLLRVLADKVTPRTGNAEAAAKQPTLILSIDQGEELFLAEAQKQASPFLALLRDLLTDDTPAITAVFAIRSDKYEELQMAKELDGLKQATFSLPPMPKGSYAEVIKGPVRRLEGTPRAFHVEDTLVEALLADIEAGGAKDALPLLAFTLERLYSEYHSGGSLKLAHYDAIGRVKGSIEAAVERALKAADADPAIPRERGARLALLRRGFVPWLAGVDPDTGAPRRRVARLAEIPAEARPLIQHLVGQHLLATDVNKETGEPTIEPAHEALLRQWGTLNGWLTEDAGLLAVLDGVKRASRDWAANNKDRAWLAYAGDRLSTAERLFARSDLAANLDVTDRAYITACRKAEIDAKRVRQLLQGIVYVSLIVIILGLVGVIKQDFLKARWRWWTVTRPYAVAQVWPHVLTAAQERALKSGNSFRECAQECPEMVVVPSGSFMMGSLPTEKGHLEDEEPRHRVTIAKEFAVSKYQVTFNEWDACSSHGDCKKYPPDGGWGRGTKPVMQVNWDDAQEYVEWLSKVTGRPYRLLSEAEYEYAARAGTETAYPWGPDITLNGQAMANCAGCGSDREPIYQTVAVGSFPPNKFSLYDMVGNLWSWVEDCEHPNYYDAPTDGMAWTTGKECHRREVRGGTWNDANTVRSAKRGRAFRNVGDYYIGFRVGRTLGVTRVD
jgi:formylglycine-generating enzyme required for sulfatase activity